jgi:hypothetical protein
MTKKIRAIGLFFLATLLITLTQGVSAHIPLSGEVDNESLDKALILIDPLKSWVIYKELHTAGDANYYKFDLDQNARLSANLLIPVTEKDTFLPGLIIMGPGITDQGTAPSFIQIPNGTHVMVIGGKMPNNAYYALYSSKLL